MNTPNIFLSAGEASGDHYGAELIASVRAQVPLARFTGLGGTAMEQQGQQRIVRAEDVAVMGITEIVRHLPVILRSYRLLVRSIQTARPDVAVLIDFPDVNFRLAKHLKRMGVPVIWFVSPQLWAWKRRRLRWVQTRVWKMLAIFPFEKTFYSNRSVQAEFVGHPLAEQPLPTVTREQYALAHSLDAAKPWIALLPGSRGGEIDAHFPVLVDTARLLGPGYQYLVPLAPTVSEDRQQRMQELLTSGLHLVADARAALLHSRAAVVASGTATVQAAVIGTPFVVVYKVSGLTFRLAKALVRFPAEVPAELDQHGNLPIAMVNLVAGRRVVPELLQQHFTAQNVVAALMPLLAETPERQRQIEALAEVRCRLLSPTERTSIESLRDAVMEALSNNTGTASASNAVIQVSAAP